MDEMQCPMTREYEKNYDRKREYLRELADEGAVTQTDADAIGKLCDAFDEDSLTVTKPNWPDAPGQITGYRSTTTLIQWTQLLTYLAQELVQQERTPDSLFECSPRDFNHVFEQWLDDGGEIKDDNLSKASVRGYQNTLRIFCRYHDEMPDFDQIPVFETEYTSIDPRDMLDSEEITALRNAPTHPRDQAIIDLLLYCGLRNNGLRTLRIKDVDVAEGEWRFNPDGEHLKHIYKPQAPRPLLGATASVREWLDYHPHSDDPDAYLITGHPKYVANDDPYTPVSDDTIRRAVDDAKVDAEIEKPVYPHMLRHNFVTLCKRDYDLSDDTVKFLIGHSPDSTVMETTYAHLSAEDYKEKAEVGAGISEPDSESPLTPDICPQCREPIPIEDAKLCPRCGNEFTPDARQAQQTIEDGFYDAKGDADEEDEPLIDALREAVKNNPELKQALLEEL